jgi:hypothetical protein
MEIKLFWSKKDKDWKFNYPDRAGKSLMGVFFDLIKTKGHRMDWEIELSDILRAHGYDPTTFEITCKKIEK